MTCNVFGGTLNPCSISQSAARHVGLPSDMPLIKQILIEWLID